jgi:hypothetical protein
VGLKPGDVIDNKYEIAGPPLRRGGMGAVRRAREHDLARNLGVDGTRNEVEREVDLRSSFGR